jgi:valyl-tRNA synthetase
MTIDKNFDPAAIEAKWYKHWEDRNAFRPEPTAENPRTEPYTIVNPPPNVTGSLHIGHALDNTLQDILIRHARLQGKDALWVVGTDHAGIATQMVVERQMNARQQKRTDFTREEFIAKVWEWKEESGGEITRQLRRLGCSMDWSREQFTMSPEFTRAVTKVFVDLYNQGLIYRDKRLVNWDPGLKTAISDLEVETREINGKFWHFKYPLEDGSGFISVATTRPETMLADMAVAVNPSDERYAHLVGQNVRLPITGRLIPIVADEHADPELGSGAVKVTPGHDFNDFEVGKRAEMAASQMLNMLDAEARIVQCGNIPDALLGLSVADARKEVVAFLEAAGLLEKVEDRVIQTPYGDRSGVVIEPWLTDQWYVDAETLAKPAIEAVRSGAIDVVPKTWEKTYFNWMENIQPWCVSRQLWWGHRIPAWYYFNHITLETNVYVAETQDKFEVLLYASDGNINEIVYFDSRLEALSYSPADGIQGTTCLVYRDNDVLDTWFSSALWPFATLGWPVENQSPPSLLGGVAGDASAATDGGAFSPPPLATPAVPLPETSSGRNLLERHYPGDILVSGFDILFFWNARMIMQGLHFMEQAPFKTLYLHGLVRAADGSKMSKSKGNTVDPLGLIDQYGADALRFFMAAMESQGRDIKMDESRVAGYRNFATKLWNAARFAQSNGIGASTSVAAPDATLAVNKWIIGEVVETLEKLNRAFDEFRFDAMADCVYHFVWDQFCDWYLELIKPAFVDGEKQDMDGESKIVAGWVLDQILVMLHPFMPFITEELWHSMADPASPRNYDIIHANWPEPEAKVDTEAKAELNWVIALIDAIRSARADNQIPPGSKLSVSVSGASEETVERLQKHQSAIAKIARIDTWNMGAIVDGIQVVVGEATYTLAYESSVDPAVERERLNKAIEAVSKETAALSARLNNSAFVEKAKPEAVEKARADLAEKSAEAERLTAALARLG